MIPFLDIHNLPFRLIDVHKKAYTICLTPRREMTINVIQYQDNFPTTKILSIDSVILIMIIEPDYEIMTFIPPQDTVLRKAYKI